VACAFAWVYGAVMPKVRIGMLVAAVMSTSLAVATPAHADNGTDFLAMLSAEGFNVGDTPPDLELTLTAGTTVCLLLNHGQTPQEAGQVISAEYPNATSQQITGLVGAAQAKLCTQQTAPRQQAGW
jgi:Protein of unknown function (DUF732)